MPKIFAQLACPSTTPATIKIMAAQNVGVTGSCKKKYAHVIVLNGTRLLNSTTWLARQWRSALFQSA